MAKSLQEQLLGAGVANKKQAANAKKARNKKIKQQKSGLKIEDNNLQRLQKAQEQKTEKDRELNRQREKVATQKAVAAQVKQIIEHSRQVRSKNADTQFNFSDGSTVKYLHVSEEQREHLTKGFLAIARCPCYCRWLCRRHYQQPHLSGSLHRINRPQRGRAGSF